MVAGPALHAWPSAWVGWAAGLRGSADVLCNFLLLTLWLQGWWRWVGVLPGVEPMGLLELGPAAFGDTPPTPAPWPLSFPWPHRGHLVIGFPMEFSINAPNGPCCWVIKSQGSSEVSLHMEAAGRARGWEAGGLGSCSGPAFWGALHSCSGPQFPQLQIETRPGLSRELQMSGKAAKSQVGTFLSHKRDHYFHRTLRGFRTPGYQKLLAFHEKRVKVRLYRSCSGSWPRGCCGTVDGCESI